MHVRKAGCIKAGKVINQYIDNLYPCANSQVCSDIRGDSSDMCNFLCK